MALGRLVRSLFMAVALASPVSAQDVIPANKVQETKAQVQTPHTTTVELKDGRKLEFVDYGVISEHAYASGNGSVAIGDLNNDGYPDIVPGTPRGVVKLESIIK